MTKPFYGTNEIGSIRYDAGALLRELHQAAAFKSDTIRILESLDAGADVDGRIPVSRS